MIKAITVTNELGEALRLDLARPELSGFAVTSITGLGPGTATINTTELATTDGSLFNSARSLARNIVISIKYLWNNSIEDARQKSYKYFPLKKRISLLVETDNRKAEVVGYVESNEPTIFSKSEGSDISIICPDPFFYDKVDTGVNETVLSGIESLFEFPFSNESLTENLLEVSAIKISTTGVVVYNGDSEIGVNITMHAIGEASGIAIYNTDTREVMRIDTDKIAAFTGSGIGNGDDILISTIKGSKYIHLLRNGVVTNILNCLDRTSDWLHLNRGDNVFVYTAESGVNNLYLTIENRVIYEGV